MADEPENTESDAASEEDAASQIQAPAETATVPEAHPPEYPSEVSSRASVALPLERFSDVQVEIAVEIGQVTMPIGEMLRLGEGSVVELDRSVTEPVDIKAQGVLIASGEVVVIDDRFAVRITDIARDTVSHATDLTQDK